MVTISTFESATKFSPGTALIEKIGTPYYIAPEVLEKSYGPKCDVWSLGVICYICLYAKAPFEGSNDEEIMESVKEGHLNLTRNSKQSYTVSNQAKDFLKWMLDIDENERPSAEEALGHPWLKSFNADVNKESA